MGSDGEQEGADRCWRSCCDFLLGGGRGSCLVYSQDTEQFTCLLQRFCRNFTLFSHVFFCDYNPFNTPIKLHDPHCNSISMSTDPGRWPVLLNPWIL